MADIFDVLADSTRRDLLQVLLDKFVASDGDVGELSVGEMVELLAISQPSTLAFMAKKDFRVTLGTDVSGVIPEPATVS